MRIDNESTVTVINEYAFNTCNSLKTITIPASVKYIGIQAFSKTGLTSVVFESRTGWTVNTADSKGNLVFVANISTDDMADAATAAEYLKNTYKANILYRDPATVEEPASYGWFNGNYYVDGVMVTDTEMAIGDDYYVFDAEGNFEIVKNDGDHTANY